MLKTWFSPRKTPFYRSLDTKLLRFGKRDVFHIRDAAEGVLILGGVGSGKSSGSGKALREAYLKAGFGGLVLCAKPDEAAIWKKELKRQGRKRDAIVIDSNAAERFNILDYAASTLAANGFEQNLVMLMERFAEAARVASTGSAESENRFFIDAAMKWLSHVFPFLMLVEDSVRLRDVYEMVVSAPKSLDETKSSEWQSGSYCSRVLLKAADRAQAGDARAARVIEEHGEFWFTEIPSLGDKTRSSIEATLTNLIYPFLAGKMAELFSSNTTVTPEAARNGKIIILDLPALSCGPMGAVAQSIFKYLFGLAMQRETVTKKTRPVFIWIDEVQFFLSATDAELLSTARSSRTCCVFITQDLPTFYAQLGHQNRDVADSIISKFGTRIFHANTSRETNDAAAEIIGKVTRYNSSKSSSRGSNSGGSINQGEWHGGSSGADGQNRSVSESFSTYQDYEIKPDYFATNLRSGGPRNRMKVDGIIIRSGRIFAHTSRHWIKAEFQQ